EADHISIIRDNSLDIELYVDPDLYKSCILNVITNAFHAMGSKSGEGILRIREEIVNDTFVLTILDNGAGVKPEDLEKIFEPFFSTKQDGLGLGLPMTRRVMEEHGGKVELRSVVGEGSEVRLTLPLPTVR